MIDSHDNRTSAREQAPCLLESYLETSLETSLDRAPVFVRPRSQRVDELLCRWAFDKQEVSDQLLGALQEVPPMATPAELEVLGSGAPAAAARRVHPLLGLQGRLNAYLHELQVGLEVDPEGDTLTPDENDVPIYVHIPLGTRTRRRGSTSPRRLRSMVRSWDRLSPNRRP